jgi:lipopolysaccharide/colanic/teichoic acid biosynthesis glycosyltransferase
MEFTFLPKATQKSREFVHYTIRSKEIKEAAYNKSGFYYIGKNPANIEKLVKLFKRGYASDNIENAKSELKRCLMQEKNTIPEIIFCESQFDFAAVRSFCLFLNNHKSLSSIPVVLDATNLCEIELNLYKKHKLADEITFLQETDEKSLMLKIQFLKKVKLKAVDLQNESGIKKGMQSLTTTLQSLNVHFTFKRSFDIAISLIALCLLSPIFLLIALAINIESKGPVFYIAKRAGRGYRIFNFYKFRTMFVGADKRISEFSHLNQYNTNASEGPAFFKIDNDPRVTKVGSFLRNSSLDELPQLINVLLGDMSLVGNRPLPLYEAATLTTDECAKRFLAPAGMTGLWQIKKRGKKDMSVEERINLDIDYANKYSFMYDLWIMANTPSALIQKSSA